MLEDIFRDTPVYQEVLVKGEEKGRQEGKLEAQRQTLLDIVEERFHAISRMAKQQANTIQDPEVLRRLTVKISVAKTSKEAEEYLLNPFSTENKHCMLPPGKRRKLARFSASNKLGSHFRL